MDLTQARVVLTGATGGIGREIATALTRAGAHLMPVARDSAALAVLAAELHDGGATVEPVVADLATAEGRVAVADAVTRRFVTADVVINNAALMDFTRFDTHEPHAIERLLQVNLVAPLTLTRLLLPGMIRHGGGRIVNVGSTFGSIGFPYFAAYCATKFAMRGFSEALRRELEGTGVGVSYVAPRSTRTSLNNDTVVRMNQALNITMDPPALVARAVIRAVTHERDEVYIGWPERFYMRINALCPRLIDQALRRQHPVIRRFIYGN